MISIKQFTVNHFMVNCYLLADEVSRQCAIVDPGMSADSERQAVDDYIRQHALRPALLLLTHAHVDHVAGLREAADRYGLPVSLHQDGVPLLAQAATHGPLMGFLHVASPEGLRMAFVEDGSKLSLGDGEIEVRHTPGHCVGSVCYVLHAEKAVLTGDTLFRGSIGRTDLPGGDLDTLMSHLYSRILTLPDDYEVLPGHGDGSTIGFEKRSNPFL